MDQHATFFLSSGEAQRCVFALWRGLLVPQIKEDGSTEYMPVCSRSLDSRAGRRANK